MAEDTRHYAICDACGKEDQITEPETFAKGWAYLDLSVGDVNDPITKDLCPPCLRRVKGALNIAEPANAQD